MKLWPIMVKIESKSVSLQPSITVVIPSYKVKSQILGVIESIGPDVQKIIVVDDACPEKCGDHVNANTNDPRVEVIFHPTNLGVGGAVKTGYKRALEIGSDIIVKIDGDGQMDTTKIGELISPIRSGVADYAKGNRFINVEAVRVMPKIRILGNLGLSFLTKLSSGYWRIFDPNNGFTAIASKTLESIPLEKIDHGYFFESDMLFRLNLINARVIDVSMPAIYQGEKSNLKIRRVLVEFPLKHSRNLIKRVLYTYYLRDFNLASIELPLGLFLCSFGTFVGVHNWIQGVSFQRPTQTGTLILIAMSILSGLQFVLAFLSYDTREPERNSR
jgi:dolichol-phosphate mannosyltransferase